jgi:hypothetical protein
MSRHCHVCGRKNVSVKCSVLFAILNLLPHKMENLCLVVGEKLDRTNNRHVVLIKET